MILSEIACQIKILDIADIEYITIAVNELHFQVLPQTVSFGVPVHVWVMMTDLHNRDKGQSFEFRVLVNPDLRSTEIQRTSKQYTVDAQTERDIAINYLLLKVIACRNYYNLFKELRKHNTQRILNSDLVDSFELFSDNEIEILNIMADYAQSFFRVADPTPA